MKKLKSLRNKKGFTLIELLTVIAILGILVLIAAPKFLGYTEKAKNAHVQSDIKTFETVLAGEMTNNEEFLKGLQEFEEVSELTSKVDNNQVYSSKGLIKSATELESKYWKLDLSKIKTKSNLGGQFLLEEDGDVIFINEIGNKVQEAVIKWEVQKIKEVSFNSKTVMTNLLAAKNLLPYIQENGVDISDSSNLLIFKAKEGITIEDEIILSVLKQNENYTDGQSVFSLRSDIDYSKVEQINYTDAQNVVITADNAIYIVHDISKNNTMLIKPNGTSKFKKSYSLYDNPKYVEYISSTDVQILEVKESEIKEMSSKEIVSAGADYTIANKKYLNQIEIYSYKKIQ